MTPRPRPYHRAEAERMLAEADAWAAVAGEPTPEANEQSYLGYAAVHALLAIHDTLTAANRYAANEAKQREGQMDDAWQSRDWETVSRLQDEAAQRAAVEPDPLDEDDHRDRLDRDGGRIIRKGPRHWHTPIFRTVNCDDDCGRPSLADWDRRFGPLTFAPDAAGAPSVTPSADDDPADDAVDGEEGERRYLNAQTAREILAIVGRWAGKCLHVWAEDTRVGDTARHFICTECGITRTEERQ